MAFKTNNLSVLAYANGFTLWHYKTTDTKAVTMASTYFADMSKVINANDFIFINASDQSVIAAVSAVTDTAVTLVAM